MDLTILKWRKKTPLKAIANYFGVTTPIEVALVMNWRGLRGNWSVPTVQAKTFVWKKKVVLIINRLSQNKVTNTINPNQNCAQWGQIFQSIWLGSAYSLRKKRPKNNFQTQGVPTTGDCAYALWIQQHSVIKFFGTPCIYSPIDFSTCHPLETTWILTFKVPNPSTGHKCPAPLLYLIQVSVSWAEGSFDSSRACLSQWCSVILTSMCPL